MRTVKRRVSIRSHIVPKPVRGLSVIATENPADKRRIPEQIPIPELIELPARGHQRGADERAPRAACPAAVRFQAAGEIHVLHRDETRVETTDLIEIPLPEPEQPEAHPGEGQISGASRLFLIGFRFGFLFAGLAEEPVDHPADSVHQSRGFFDDLHALVHSLRGRIP